MKFFYILFLCSIFSIYTMNETNLIEEDNSYVIIESDSSNEEISIRMKFDLNFFFDTYKDKTSFLNIFSDPNCKNLIENFFEENDLGDISLKDIGRFENKLKTYYNDQNNQFEEQIEQKTCTERSKIVNGAITVFSVLSVPILFGYSTAIVLFTQPSCFLPSSIVCGATTGVLSGSCGILHCVLGCNNKKIRDDELKNNLRIKMIKNALEYLNKKNS